MQQRVVPVNSINLTGLELFGAHSGIKLLNAVLQALKVNMLQALKVNWLKDFAAIAYHNRKKVDKIGRKSSFCMSNKVSTNLVETFLIHANAAFFADGEIQLWWHAATYLRQTLARQSCQKLECNRILDQHCNRVSQKASVLGSCCCSGQDFSQLRDGVFGVKPKILSLIFSMHSTICAAVSRSL